MNDAIYVVCGLLILAIVVNSLSVFLQKNYRIYDRVWNKKRAHLIHAITIYIFWGAFIASFIIVEQTKTADSYRNTALGIALKAIASFVFMASLKQIGLGSLSNKDLFTGERKELKGIYSYVSEPIYTSYTLFFLGSALTSGISAIYYCSLISLIGLQIIEAKIENS